MSNQLVSVSLACNDARNGSFVGHTEAVDFDSWPDGDHVSVIGRRTRVVFGGGVVSVGRRKFSADQRRKWDGNWCWDSVSMGLDDARKLLGYLLKLGWSVTEETFPDNKLIAALAKQAEASK